MRVVSKGIGALTLCWVLLVACNPLLSSSSDSGQSDPGSPDGESSGSVELLNRAYFSLTDDDSEYLVILRVDGDPTFTDTLWSERQIPELGSRVTGLTYGDGVWVLVQERGPILRSEDTLTWVSADGMFSELDFESVAFSDGVYMAVTRDGLVFVSRDRARSWRQVPHTTDFEAASVFQNRGADGVFLIGLSDGRIYRSTDYGETWTDTGESTMTMISNFRYLGDHRWLAAGGSGVVYSEDHGEQWKQATHSSSSTALRGIAVEDGSAYILGNNGGPIFEIDSMTSDSTLSSAGRNASYLEVGHGVLVAATGGTSQYGALIRYSTDGGDSWDGSTEFDGELGRTWAALRQRGILLFGLGTVGETATGTLLASTPLVETEYRDSVHRVDVDVVTGSSAAEIAFAIADAIDEQTPHNAEATGNEIRVSSDSATEIDVHDVDTGFEFGDSSADSVITVQTSDQ